MAHITAAFRQKYTRQLLVIFIRGVMIPALDPAPESDLWPFQDSDSDSGSRFSKIRIHFGSGSTSGSGSVSESKSTNRAISSTNSLSNHYNFKQNELSLFFILHLR